MDEEKKVAKHSSNNETGSKGKKIVICIIALLVVIAISGVIWYNISLGGTGTSEEKVKIEIPIGTGTNKILDILKENDLIKSPQAFKIYVKLNKVSAFQAGTYTLTKDMSVPEIVQALQTGKVFKESNVSITFVEGKTYKYIAKQIAANTDNTEEDVYAVLEDKEYIKELIDEYWFLTDEIENKDIYYALEGYLFPDTYSFEDEKVTVKEIFKTLLDQTKKVLDTYKEEIEKSKYTVHEILTIASIIENEAIFDKDRKDVSSVVYNRLEKKMSIGSDVTTYYAFKIDLGSRDLNKTELNTYNPYNTRGPNMAGKLPVGPICMPGKASIEAAIYPSETDYLFFVADASGNIYFTKTNAEHEKAIQEIKANNAWVQFK